MNVYSISEVCSTYISIQGKRFEGRMLPPRQKMIQVPEVHQGPFYTLISVLIFVGCLVQTGLFCLYPWWFFHACSSCMQNRPPCYMWLHPGESASWLDMHMVSGARLRTVLSWDSRGCVKETEPSCAYVGAGKWAERHNLIFICSIQSSSHLPQCYFLIKEKQPAGFHYLLETISHTVKEEYCFYMWLTQVLSIG